MTTIHFYHLISTPLERALPKLLEKCVTGGFSTLLVSEPEEYLEHLNQLLWTYDPATFLPHGTLNDGNAEKQPILLSSRIEPLNNARLLLITNGATPESPEAFERILDVFDGNDPQTVANARIRWSSYKKDGYEMAYFRQTESGGWAKAA